MNMSYKILKRLSFVILAMLVVLNYNFLNCTDKIDFSELFYNQNSVYIQ